jgi:hypothetical protein
MIPAIDQELVGSKTIDELINLAKKQDDLLSNLDLRTLQSFSSAALAQALAVPLAGTAEPSAERTTKVDKPSVSGAWL